MELARIFRRNQRAIYQISASVTRAPKKKDKKGGKGAAAGPVSDDIVNIFKEKEDPIILPSEYYPDWIFEHVVPHQSSIETTYEIIQGKRLPMGNEQWSFMKNTLRQRIKHKNQLGNQDAVYESDDDFNEPDDYETAKIMKEQATEEAKAEEEEVDD